MKNIVKVTILFCIIIACFVVPSFAVNFTVTDPVILPVYTPVNGAGLFNNGYCVRDYVDSTYTTRYYSANDNQVYMFGFFSGRYVSVFCVSPVQSRVYYSNAGDPNNPPADFYSTPIEIYNSTYQLYTGSGFNLRYDSDANINYYIPVYSSIEAGYAAVRDYIDNPPSQYSKNPNVDEFIANTMISLGVKFETPAYALSYASDAWDWCIDETNMESAHPFDEWDIDNFVSYCNAQSNNYLNWYNGYKIPEDVSNALGEYIRQNIRSLTGLPAGITSLTGAYLPIYHYGSGFQSGVSSPTAQTFYPAQTITYFNGEFLNEPDDISSSQFLYTPADVRRFLGYPGSSPSITPSTPTGTGTITDDPNNPDQKNININFPSLDWLADAIKSILDFLRDAFTTLANLLTQLLDAILGLFSDAFESLQDFGQGIIDFIQSVFSGLSDLLSGYVPSDISVIIVTFIALNLGIGLITFVLKGH